MWQLLAACTSDPPKPRPACDATDVPDSYIVEHRSEPEPIVARQSSEFFIEIEDQDGCPIEDLQQSHERMVHTLFISRDLESFQHIHHEDFYPVTADDVRSATFHFPVTFPAAGATLVVFDFAHRNAWQQDEAFVEVTGSPPQLSQPRLDFATDVAVDDIVVSFEWEIAPVAGFEAAVALTIRDATKGADVTDLVQWLGADGHVAFVSTNLDVAGHTHAWFEGMDSMSPGMEMPAKYGGPYLPFHFTLPTGGTYKGWFQFARVSRPEDPYVVPFVFEVLP